MHQAWHDLLFAHWPVPADVLLPFIPSALTLDLYEGQAWVGVVPFRMSGVRPRFVPAIPWLSAFPELNVRTYVVRDGRRGVWFFSLDAGNSLAVAVARAVFHLPYYHARMSCRLAGDSVAYAYSSIRTHHGAEAAAFEARYCPTGESYRATPGSLAHWLTERYCLYAADRAGRLYRSEIHHAQWPLQPAEAEITANTMATAAGITLPPTKPLLHFARRQDVIVWPLELVH
jgi:uncharacterized protein YqjF (DUF2071 family)